MSDKTLSVKDATRLRLTAYYLCGAECDLPDGGVHWTRLATREDVLAAVRELEGTQERQWHGPIEVHPKGRPDLGSELPPGRYLIVPLDAGDTK
jgi:hypothetical protein